MSNDNNNNNNNNNHENSIPDKAELKESETAAALDAHGCSDPGMEAAAQERALIMNAEEIKMARPKQQSSFGTHDKNKETSPKMNVWYNDKKHLNEGARHLQEDEEETVAELRAAQDAAAWDAHDCSDPGIEAAMEERAVMLARELTQKLKKKAT